MAHALCWVVLFCNIWIQLLHSSVFDVKHPNNEKLRRSIQKSKYALVK